MSGGTGYTLTFAGAPAPEPIVRRIREIEVDCSTEEASVMRIRLGISRTRLGDWAPLDLDPFRPLMPLGLRLRVDSVVPESVINAYVLRQQASYSGEPGGSELEVTAMDATHFMNLQEKSMPWPNMPDAQIAQAIFPQYGVIPQAQPTPPRVVEPEGQTTQSGTDIRFLRSLASKHGYECFVQPEPFSGLDMGHFAPRKAIGFPDAVLSTGMEGSADTLEELSIRYEMTEPTTVVAGGVDSTTRAPMVGVAPVSTEVPMGIEPTGLRVLPPPISRPTATGAGNPGELQTIAQGIANRSSWVVVASGRVSPAAGMLRPGGLANIRGAGRVFNGSYAITRVSHRIRPGSYEQRFEARRNAVGMTGAEVYVDI